MLSFSTPGILGFLGPIGWPEMIILGILGVLIFGSRLPEVGKSLGKGIVEFKKGLKGVEDDLDDSVTSSKQLEDPEKSNRKPTISQPETPAESTTPPHSA
ncbi:MAG: twin-arginine translocase TatA/TatE family subunit [Planctomycetota bacterium]